MAIGRRVVGIGEALLDVFPDEARPGGAPLNVALHAQQLGNQGVVVSRIGQDDLGRRLVEALTARGVATDHLQTDPDRATGTVYIDANPSGGVTFDISRDVAWDALQWDPDLEDLAQRADAVTFGTLAQRDGQARNTIYRFVELARRAVRLFDVNLRPPFYERAHVQRSCELATAAKLNTEELATLTGVLNLGVSEEGPAVEAMRTRYGLKWVAVTHGPEGTIVYDAEGRHVGEPVAAQPVEGADPVGAGDAAAAALLHGAIRRWPWDRTLALANALGAYVASKPGACPELDDSIRKLAG